MSSPEILMTEQVWNNLRLPLMVLAILGPVVILLLIIRYNRIIKGLKEKFQHNQQVLAKRIEFYNRIGPRLNDIVNFFLYTGNWKELTPAGMLELKRSLDKEIAINAPLFTDELQAKYNGFIQLCFVAFSGWEHEEKIKSLYELRQENNVDWEDEWTDYFDTNNVVEGVRLKERYDQLMAYFQRDLNSL